jgi:hypothetical protein
MCISPKNYIFLYFFSAGERGEKTIKIFMYKSGGGGKSPKILCSA